MGLSDTERVTGIVAALNSIQDILDPEYGQPPKLPNGYERMLELADALWPAFMRGKSNSAYWLLGSSMVNSVQRDPLTIAILAPQVPQPRSDRMPELDAPYRYHYYLADLQNPQGVLDREENPELHTTLSLWTEVESLVYNLRRYDDELTRGLREFDDAVSRLQGELVRKMRHHNLLRAWAWAQLIRRAFQIDQSQRGRWMEEWAEKQNLHHHLRMRESYDTGAPTTEQLWAVFKKHQFKEPTMQERISIILWLMGRRYHYKHEYRQTQEFWQKYNEGVILSERVNLYRIHTLMERCYAAYEEHTRDQYSRYDFCDLTYQSPA